MTDAEHMVEPQPTRLRLTLPYGGLLWVEWWIGCAGCGNEKRIEDPESETEAIKLARAEGWHLIQRNDGDGNSWICPTCWPQESGDGICEVSSDMSGARLTFVPYLTAHDDAEVFIASSVPPVESTSLSPTALIALGRQALAELANSEDLAVIQAACADRRITRVILPHPTDPLQWCGYYVADLLADRLVPIRDT